MCLSMPIYYQHKDIRTAAEPMTLLNLRMKRRTHIWGLRATVIAFAVTACCALLWAQPRRLYEEFSRRAKDMSIEEVMRFGDRLAMQGHGDSAVAVYTVAMNRYNNRMPLNEKIACIRAHQRASDYWLNRGANLNALQVLMGARDISEAAGTDSLTIGILNNMAYVYMTFQNYEKAAAIFSDAYSLMSQKKNDDAAFRILNNLASVHIMLGDIDNAGKELRSLRKLQPASDEVKRVAPYHIMLLEGALLNHAGRYAEGAAHIRKAIASVQDLPEGTILECLALEDLIKSYQGLNLRDSVLTYLVRCEQLAAGLGLPDRQIDALKGLSRYYEQAGDKVRALDCRTKYITLSDSVMNYREFARLSNIEFVYQSDKYKNEIATLSHEGEIKSRRLRHQLWVIGVMVLVTLVIGTLLYVVWRQKRNLDESYHTLFRLFQKQSAEHEKEDEKPKDIKYAQSGLKGESAHALGEQLRTLLDDPSVICDPELSLARLSELTGSNSKYVSQAINESFGMNFSALLNERRITIARQKLTDPANDNLTIAAIAASIGYKNQTSFIASFKKIVGMTPSTFLKIAKEQRSTQSES